MRRVLSLSMIFLVFSLFTPFFASLSGAEASKCILIEPEEMKRRYEDNSIRLNNMFLFDIRPYAVAMKGRRIPMSMEITYESLENERVYEIGVWKGKDVYLVGEDTESTESFCRVMLSKNYPVNNIYVLKGGMKAWNGPVITKKFEEVACEDITLQEVSDMRDSGRKIEFVDVRSIEDYEKGHIPGAESEGMYGRDNLCLTGVFSRAIWEDSAVVFVGYTEPGTLQRCRVLKWVVGYEEMYALEGNMESWKGPLEKGRFEDRYLSATTDYTDFTD